MTLDEDEQETPIKGYAVMGEPSEVISSGAIRKRMGDVDVVLIVRPHLPIEHVAELLGVMLVKITDEQKATLQ